MPSPFHVTFDITHLVSRLTVPTPTGIDRIDLAFARHFGAEHVPGRQAKVVGGLHYGLFGPFHRHSLRRTSRLVELAEHFWQEKPGAGDETTLRALTEWLASKPGAPLSIPQGEPPRQSTLRKHQRSALMTLNRIAHNPSVELPQGTVYLNIAQHILEKPAKLRWLDSRPDLKKVFYIYDLLSIDYPEYFRAGNLELFRRRLQTASHHANAFLVSAETVKVRLQEELKRMGAPQRPIHVGHFPSPLETAALQSTTATAGGHPYFVIVGTVEPRKNHLLLLQIWREMVAQNPNAPRLLIVGGRGWECEQVVDMLERAPALKTHVAEVSGVPSVHLQQLVRNARALLMPTFGEGYGLPVVEALSVGTPAVASDIPVFQEIAHDCATLLSPLDAPAWQRAILELADENSGAFQAGKARANRFVAPTWSNYFADIEAFLAEL
ncbi:MAG TPA: glycosyltransferase family 1 protein [Beijerinckiaceae bacterium]|nr:glycosyltransferase family 1 protein [Beijerinckiaceae bacterium]